MARRLDVEGVEISHALRATLEALGIGPRTIHKIEDWLNDYTVAMAPVLLALQPVREQALNTEQD